MFAFRAYLENHLGLDIGVQEKSMGMEGYYPEYNHFDDFTAENFKKLLDGERKAFNYRIIE